MNDMIEVPRELLEVYTGKREGDWVEAGHELRALLGAPVVEREPVEREPYAWYTDDHLTDKSATTYEITTAQRWNAKGWTVRPLYI